ncbi:MAG: redoxin domain-containing protein [Planctomycetia bacterium]|nr:redoxin domain-containing protein [Planctomycetia bacterium]
MRGRLADLKQLGAQLISVDPHEVYSAQHFLKEVGVATEDLHYPLLLDPACVVSATYGVAFQMRIHTELSNRPATFVIDADGVIRYARRGQSFSDRPGADQIIEELKRLDAK